MSFRVAIIGAGSVGFSRGIVRDLLCVPEFNEIEIALTDISKKNLDMTAKLISRDIKANKSGAKLIVTTDRRKAFEGARYIFSTVRIGCLDAFKQDIEIPLKYGVDQCVGDTLCAGGILYGQRNIPAILDFCEDIRELSDNNVLFLNHANPNAMNTWAANHFGGVPTIGLCHGVVGGHWQITNVIELLINKGKKKGDAGFKPLTLKDVDIVCAGINHQTWYIQIQYQGEDWTDKILEGFLKHPNYSRTEKVRIDMLKRFGYYSTESNGHLSEYVPWYRKNPKEILKWIDLENWIHGETGGYLKVCTEGRNWFETDYPVWLKEAPWEYKPEKRGHEHGSYIIEGLETGRLYRGHFNVVNNGCITNLPEDCVVEVPGYVDRNGVNIPIVGDLPLGCAAVCNSSVQVQRLAVHAALHGDLDLLIQALMLDPLTGALLTPPAIEQMACEMVLTQSKWLPQYKEALPEARRRFKTGTRYNTIKTKGAARLAVKSVNELRAEKDQSARKNVQNADRGDIAK